jgi:putative SOS response-associated peptidase YedK
MCGRAYITYTEDELEIRYNTQRKKRTPLGFKPNYNLSPTQNSPVVLIQDGELKIELFRWGLVPFWAKDVKSADKYSLINAKAEEITEKRSYKGPFEKRRCIVPLSGFYEWKKEDDGTKQPYAIHFREPSIMSVAGIWEHWEDKEAGEIIQSFSIITVGANTDLVDLHKRMPAILDQKDEELWLDPDQHDVDNLKKILIPKKLKKIEVYPVSKLVNSPKNNNPKVLEKLK